MLKQNYRAWVEIDLSAIRHNVKSLKSVVAGELLAVVKADAYGHGAIAVSQAAIEAGATWLGVATITEGVQLRNGGITAPILILGSTNSIDEIKAIAENRLYPTICSPEQAQKFNQTLNTPLPIHLKIDTGMSRLGMDWHQVPEFLNLVQSLSHLQIHGVYSHLATADDPDQTILRLQHQRFQEVVHHIKNLNICPPILHFANTAALITDAALHYNMVRCGLGIYGFYPAPHLQAQGQKLGISLYPALQVKARITQVKTIPMGRGVSYGYSFIAPRDMDIATVAIGYADGVPRRLSNQLKMMVGDRYKVAQIGTITMDQCLIDVSDVPNVQVGDVVTVLGTEADNNADRWAELSNTITWEILCGFKHRLPRLIA